MNLCLAHIQVKKGIGKKQSSWNSVVNCVKMFKVKYFEALEIKLRDFRGNGHKCITAKQQLLFAPQQSILHFINLNICYMGLFGVTG